MVRIRLRVAATSPMPRYPKWCISIVKLANDLVYGTRDCRTRIHALNDAYVYTHTIHIYTGTCTHNNVYMLTYLKFLASPKPSLNVFAALCGENKDAAVHYKHGIGRVRAQSACGGSKG